MSRFLLLFLSCTAFAQEPSGDPRQTIVNTGKKERSLLKELGDIDRKLAQLQTEQRSLETQKSELEIRRQKNQVEADKANQDLRDRQIELKKSMNALYKLHRRGLARVIFGAENPVELRRRGSYLMSLIKVSTKRMEHYQTAFEARKSSLEALTEDENQLASIRTEMKIKEAELKDQKAQKQSFLKDVRSKRKTALQLLEEVNQSRQSLQERLSVSVSRPVQQKPVASFRSQYGKLSWPVYGKLSKRFGKQIDKITGQKIESLGIDIEAPFGTPIRAVHTGVVTLAQFIPAYGQTVAIKHGDFQSVYAHMNGINVRQGQHVSAGQTLGYVGNTGLTGDTNRYLVTFEIRYKKSAQDPLPWLKRR